MDGQLHITHRSDFLRGRLDGKADAKEGRSYRPGEGWPRSGGDTDGQRAYRIGYADGWDEGNPCSNGTCGHLAHTGEAAGTAARGQPSPPA